LKELSTKSILLQTRLPMLPNAAESAGFFTVLFDFVNPRCMSEQEKSPETCPFENPLCTACTAHSVPPTSITSPAWTQKGRAGKPARPFLFLLRCRNVCFYLPD
jgi:hypothetical protein